MNLKKMVSVIVISVLVILIFAQNLEKKKGELQHLKQQISEQEQKIKEAAEKKKKSEKQLGKKVKAKKTAEKKIKKLKRNEKNIQKKLTETKSLLSDTQRKFETLNQLCNREFQNLCRKFMLGNLISQTEYDAKILANFIEQTGENLDTLQGKKQQLDQFHRKKQKEYENTKREKNKIAKKKKKYIRDIKNLKKNISRLEKQKQKYLARKKELEKEAAALDELIGKLSSEVAHKNYTFRFSTDKLIWPLNGKIIRSFGEHKSEQYNVTTVNDGIDIAAEIGTPVKAVEDGIVAYAEWHGGSGKLIIIDHENGFYSLYAHNSTLLVSKGEKVEKNQTIALSGKTGNAARPNLHFEIRKRGKPVNPLDFLK